MLHGPTGSATHAGNAPVEGKGRVSTVSKANAALGAANASATAAAARVQRIMRVSSSCSGAGQSMRRFSALSASPELQTDYGRTVAAQRQRSAPAFDKVVDWKAHRRWHGHCSRCASMLRSSRWRWLALVSALALGLGYA